LELGAAETLIVFENLEITRWTLKNSAGQEIVLHTNKQQETNREQFMDKETGQEMEVVEQIAFLEWLAEKYRDFGASLEFVSDRSSEGNQFVKGFGGIGAILRYKVNFEQLADFDDDDEFYDDDEDDDWPSEIPTKIETRLPESNIVRRSEIAKTSLTPLQASTLNAKAVVNGHVHQPASIGLRI